jgi:repressor of nif and glnA expression
VSRGNRKVEDDDILVIFKTSSDPVLTAREIMERLDVDIARNSVNYRLDLLEKEGLVRSKKAGASSVVWWITDTGEDLVEQSLYESSGSGSNQ